MEPVDPLVLLQAGAAAVLNGAFAWLVGEQCTRLWLGRTAAQFLSELDPLLRRSAVAAALTGAAAALAGLWAAAALMSGSGLAEALAVLPDVMLQTAFGRAGACALTAMAVLACLRAAGRRAAPVISGLLLLVFAVARSSVSHAGEHGLASIDVAIELLHLVLIGVWLGGVALAAWTVMPAARRRSLGLPDYLHALSQAAGAALVFILASGAWNSWRRLGSLDQLGEGVYGQALSIKLVLFAAAALLGGYNRFVGFPRASQDGGRRAILVLRVESAVMALVLLAAAWLASQQPPG